MTLAYDFTTMTRKDIFEAKLKNDVLDFAYISSAKRARFLRFCQDAGLIKFVGEGRGSIAYKVLADFTYETMGRGRPYSSLRYHAKARDFLVFDQRSRPNEHVLNRPNIDGKKWLEEIMEGEDDD